MQIVIAPNQILRSKAKLVTKVSLHHLSMVQEMIKIASKFKDPEGVGLAAPQVGILERFFIAKFDDSFKAFFNPEILFYGKRIKKFLEGCLSIPDYYGEVMRPTLIKVKYQNTEREIVYQRLTGLAAMVFQHEFDHLEGRLFVDYVMEQKSKLYKVVGKDKAGSDIFEEVVLP